MQNWKMHKISEHRCSINTQQYLTNDFEQLRRENQQLKAALRQAELGLSTREREEARQQAVLSQKICNVDQLTLEKQQMSAELGVRGVQLTQLKGLRVALGMQKQITAKREQIDFMQSRIQQLEENIMKHKMDKHRLTLLFKKQTQDLMSEKESRRRLASEVKALCSQERELKVKAEKLEAALYKMSESFSECQEFIQKQEQEIARLKLEHALDLKEMQSQRWRNVPRSPISSRTLPTCLLSLTNGLMEMRVRDPTVELKRVPGELLGGIAEEQRPHTATSFRRRPEEDHKSRQRTETKDAQRPTTRRIRSYSDFLRTAEPRKQDHSITLSAYKNAVVFREGQMCISTSAGKTGRRSPVHLLLTSDRPVDRNYWQETENTVSANLISANNQDELTGQTSRKEQPGQTLEPTGGLWSE